MQRLFIDRVTIFLFVYLFYLGCLTLAPFNFSASALTEARWSFEYSSTADITLNVFGYIPLGVILCQLMSGDRRTLMAKWGLTIATVAILSLSIETGQLFLTTRYSSISDLLANTVGGGLGFWIAYRFSQGSWIVGLQRYRRPVIFSAVTLYLGVFIGLFIWTAIPQKLEGWDTDYPLLIGNEATMDRPWRGKLFLVALYDRILSKDEIESQYRAGPHFGSESTLMSPPIALYNFQEVGGSHIRDRSPTPPPLDLQILDPHQVAWLPEGGLALMRPTVLRSNERPEKVHRRFTATHAFSVAVWIEPSSRLQYGPARIVSFSRDTGLRNFTLGQEGREIHFRVRNPVAGLNGDRISLKTTGLGLRPQPTHLVAIYDGGRSRLYADGVLFQHVMAQNGLTVIAETLGWDATSTWQRAFLTTLLLGPLAGLTLFSRRNGKGNV